MELSLDGGEGGGRAWAVMETLRRVHFTLSGSGGGGVEVLLGGRPTHNNNNNSNNTVLNDFRNGDYIQAAEYGKCRRDIGDTFLVQTMTCQDLPDTFIFIVLIPIFLNKLGDTFAILKTLFHILETLFAITIKKSWRLLLYSLQTG